MNKKQLLIYIGICLMCFSHVCYSISLVPLTVQTSATKASQELPTPAPNEKEVSPITQLGNKYHNSISLLQNRFRIDFEVDEITMVFFREYGSSPIVLVQPDGSKIFQATADGESIFWYDTSTYDMISIKNPAIGPWQAVGNISPNSRVMVISELALHAEKLPSTIFSGEILKQTAYLTNDGEPIDYTAFRDVVELVISLSSTNNPNYNNFGADPKIIATFQDNGKGMDETPLDGVFTGQFNLAVPDGEWIPTFKVSTPMYSREQVDPNIMLLPNPINISVDVDDGTGGYHKLKVDGDREYINISTLLIDGKVRYPNGDIQNFSITDMSDNVREHDIIHFDFGIYRVKLTAFGSTLDGREFILDVPEYSFLVEEPKPVPKQTNGQATSPDVISPQEVQNEKTIEPALAVPVDEGMSNSTLVSLIVGINLFLLIVGGGLIWLITSDKKIRFSFKKKVGSEASSETVKEPTDSEVKLGFFAKLFKRKPKQVTVAPSEPNKQPEDTKQLDSGFKDLSLPKD
ncbi:TIGR03503 family protein [Paraglaciecola aquimarina]|uniref:TIGR03503 family protein n=1 Tax=Paraglaciecola algarum TaxID=3050085 RepID=A0ABS9D3T4_9ALTE|nr:TIGR03503 family protein [Paraglaciecola sp. G1-23]MCF2946687.1 TIGR03503 family protein [Paraglaciecola sp. G1-23]